MSREGRRTFGRAAAKRAWEAVGLAPVTEAEPNAAALYGEPKYPQIQRWLRERTEHAPGQWVESSLLYDDFVAWCRDVGEESVHISAFGLDLRRNGYEPWKYGTIRRRGLRLVRGIEHSPRALN